MFLGRKVDICRERDYGKNPHSCTVLIKGPNVHTIAQIKDAVRDGLTSVKNTLEDEAVILGAGAFEVASRQYLVNEVMKTIPNISVATLFYKSLDPSPFYHPRRIPLPLNPSSLILVVVISKLSKVKDELDKTTSLIKLFLCKRKLEKATKSLRLE